eukprot:scaffold1389_cov107-Isochrysis_galbana.AAC.3
MQLLEAEAQVPRAHSARLDDGRGTSMRVAVHGCIRTPPPHRRVNHGRTCPLLSSMASVTMNQDRPSPLL